MNDLSLVDLFFIITGVAVVIITILLGIGLIYLVMFLRTIKNVARTAQRATEIVSGDLSDLRHNIKSQGVSVNAFTNFAKSLARKKILRKK